MLSELVIASAETRIGKSRRKGISVSSFFPCPYRMYKVYKGEEVWDVTGEAQLNMENGWWQEEESIKHLEEAGVEVFERQHEVILGRARSKGHIDGLVEPKGLYLWEHKAMSSWRASSIRQKGLDGRPDIKAQVNCYMMGLLEEGFNISGVCVYVKDRDNNSPWDNIYPYDAGFANMIVDWVDRIVVDGWDPEPKECKYCAHCGLSEQCFKDEIPIDFSGIRQFSIEDAVKKWHAGKAYRDAGSLMVEDARKVFIEAMGEEDTLIATDPTSPDLNDLRIQRIITKRQDFNKTLFVQKYGAIALLDVLDEKEVPQVRVTEFTPGGK